jgi:hypothetical protein
VCLVQHNTHTAPLRSRGKDSPDNLLLLSRYRTTHRYSIPRIRLGFEDTGAVTDLHQTHIESRIVRPRKSSVPDCRPNQKRNSAEESPAGSVTTADRRGADRGTDFAMSSWKRKGTGMQDHSTRRTQGFCATAPRWQPDCCRRWAPLRASSFGVPVRPWVSCIPSHLIPLFQRTVWNRKGSSF